MKLVSVEKTLLKGDSEDFEDKLFEGKEDLEKKDSSCMTKSRPRPADGNLAYANFVNTYGISKAVHSEGMTTNICGCCGCNLKGEKTLCDGCKHSFESTNWHKSHLE